MGMGPAIEDGFYYDFDFGKEKISEEDLKKISREMKKIIKKGHLMRKGEWKVSDAKAFFKNQPYKLELIQDLEREGAKKVSIYKTGADFTDLCSGPHAEKTNKVGAFKLTRISGAYWKGSEKNPMMSRIYGAAFSSKEELDKYLFNLGEAKKRDHRKIGQELGLFTFSDLVGPGLPLFTPEGTIVRNELYQALLEASATYKVGLVTIPHIAKRKLYEISGHTEKFSDQLFSVKSNYGEEFVLKPVNCPHHTQIYASRKRSYQELPIRFMESTMQYRDEKPGELLGLVRVRSITVDDGHTFCTANQIKEEAKSICAIIEEFYKKLGLFGQHWVSLSVRDKKTPEKYIGDPKDWEKAEKMLEEVSDELNLAAQRKEGEAALYGPKLDYIFKDSLGRDWQLATVQIDFAMPKRFDLAYTDRDGKEKTPVMLHRAILGSYERFLVLLLEHFNGALPLWLSPLQVITIPISEKHHQYAKEIARSLELKNIRSFPDLSDNTMQAKIRDAQLRKIPLMLIVGEREEKNSTVSVRLRDGRDLGEKTLKEATLAVESIISKRALELWPS